MKIKRLSILLSLIALGTIAVVLAAALFIHKSGDDKIAYAQFQPQVDRVPEPEVDRVLEEGAPVKFPFDEFEAEVRAHIANMPPLEAAQYLSINAVSLPHLVFEVLDRAIQQREGLDPALQKKLKLIELLMLRGQVYNSRLGDYAKARDDFARVVQLEPQFGEAHSELGGALRVLGETDAAIVELKTAIDLGYDSPNTRVALAHAYEEKGEKNLAIENFKKVLELDPHGRSARINLERLEKE